MNETNTPMSIQEMKSHIHHLVDELQDKTILEEVALLLTKKNRHDILDDLTEQQLTGLEKAREEAQNEQSIALEDFKRKMESKWPKLKSL